MTSPTVTPSGRLDRKSALVTGGGTGIGAAIVQRFAAEGARLTILDLDGESARRVGSAVGGIGVEGDASNAADVRRAVEAAVNEFSRLDIVIANAGVHVLGSVGELDDENWERALRGNLTTAFASAKGSLDALASDGGGALVIVASVAAFAAGPRMTGYTTAKTALLGLTRSLAVDYGYAGIRVNAICPGWVRTPMAEQEMDGLGRLRGIDRDQAFSLAAENIPLGRAAAPSEIAAATLFLASDDASFVSGTALTVDGGMSAVSVGMLPFKTGKEAPLGEIRQP